jgi:hypothetical protein
MNTETLIHNLALECRPVTPVSHPAVMSMKAIFAAATLVGTGVLILRPFPGAAGFLADPAFVTLGAAMLGVALICSASAFFLAVPNERKIVSIVVPIAAAVLLPVSAAYFFAAPDVSDSRPTLICIMRIFGLSVVPALWTFYMLKKAAPMRAGLIGLLVVLSSLSFAAVGVQFVCRSPFPTHIIVWHVLPVFILATVGIFVGRLLFVWNVDGRVAGDR